jgi:hypothetical protein
MIKNKAGAAYRLNPQQNKSNISLTHEEEIIKILTYGKPKVVGKIQYIDGKAVFSKQVKESEHLFRNFNAWGFQEEILPKLSKKNNGLCT